MAIIENEFVSIFSGSVKRKSNKTQKLKSGPSPKRVAQKVAVSAPEVMVKITGFSKGAKSVYNNLTYVSRNGNVELETDTGLILSGREEVKEYFNDWKADLGAQKSFPERRDSMHIVLSMPPGTQDDAVKGAVRDFAKEQFGGRHEYVFALHTDEKHPHCHLIVKYRDFNGNRPSHTPEDLQKWREAFADKMEEYGVMANATPRISRGVVKKPERQALLHMQRGGETRAPRTPKVIALAERDAAASLVRDLNGSPVPNDYDKKAIARQQVVRNAWRSMAEKLSAPKPPLTIDSKEISNDRPNYERIARSGVSGRLRASTLHKSYPAEAGLKESSRSIAGMRDVSQLPVVRNKRPAQMLLSRDALHRVGWRDGPDNDMRRTGIGTERTAGGLNQSDAQLARNIKAFVERMPEVQTRRQALQRELHKAFSQRSANIAAGADKAMGKGEDRSLQQAKPRDIER